MSLSSSFFSSLIGTLLFLMNHRVCLHSIDGRPLSLALLTGFIFLFFYLSCIQKKNCKKEDIFWIISSQYLFAVSIGLQPIIFIITLFLSSFWLTQKKLFKLLFFSHALTAVLVLPYYIKMILFARKADKYRDGFIDRTLSYIENFNIQSFFQRFFSEFYDQMWMVFLLISITSGIVFLKKKNVSFKKQDYSYCSSFISIVI